MRTESFTTSPSNTPDRLLRRPQVEAMTAMSCAAIYAKMDEGRFPAPRPHWHRPEGGSRLAAVRYPGMDRVAPHRRSQEFGRGVMPCAANGSAARHGKPERRVVSLDTHELIPRP